MVWKILRARASGIKTRKISVGDIGKVYDQISSQAAETSFAVFVISPPRWDSGQTVEIQFSVEKGVTGLDWILMSENNKKEKQRIVDYAIEKGTRWQDCKMNDWIYMRIEQGDLVVLCISLIRDLYGAEEVLLKYGGFKYR